MWCFFKRMTIVEFCKNQLNQRIKIWMDYEFRPNRCLVLNFRHQLQNNLDIKIKQTFKNRHYILLKFTAYFLRVFFLFARKLNQIGFINVNIWYGLNFGPDIQGFTFSSYKLCSAIHSGVPIQVGWSANQNASIERWQLTAFSAFFQ